MSAYCPHCGHNIGPLKQVERGRWALTEVTAHHFGRAVSLSRQQCAFLFAIAAAGDRPVRGEVIGSRISDSEGPANLASVMAHRIRKVLGADTPFEAVHGRGYRWREAA